MLADISRWEEAAEAHGELFSTPGTGPRRLRSWKTTGSFGRPPVVGEAVHQGVDELDGVLLGGGQTGVASSTEQHYEQTWGIKPAWVTSKKQEPRTCRPDHRPARCAGIGWFSARRDEVAEQGKSSGGVPVFSEVSTDPAAICVDLLSAQSGSDRGSRRVTADSRPSPDTRPPLGVGPLSGSAHDTWASSSEHVCQKRVKLAAT